MRPTRQSIRRGFTLIELMIVVAIIAVFSTLAIPSYMDRVIRAQVLIGRDIYRENFGSDPSGFWLPECAYAPGVEALEVVWRDAPVGESAVERFQ